MSWQVGLYVAAVLIPLLAFVVELFGGKYLKRLNAYVATGAIGLSFLLSLIGFIAYFSSTDGVFAHHGGEAHAEAGAEAGHEVPAAGEHGEAKHDDGHGVAKAAHSGGKMPPKPLIWDYSFSWVSVGQFIGTNKIPSLSIDISIHIDNLSVIMFLMVTFIATLIHIYSMGYMHDDPRYPRFFTYLSLFCFSMLGLVASGNIFMIFMFWELVGVCSYFLIGFWYEEKKNSDAANKAFITNRVGDVGMLIGLGLIWSYLGTFNIEDINRGLRGSDGQFNYVSIQDNSVEMRNQETGKPIPDDITGGSKVIPMWLLTVAGLGIFAGCVGKSAQFPLHVWLPDAMAGPTPVSAMVHAATMVAAGVYLVGRFFPLFTEPALLYIAYTGGITLFIAATIAMVQTDYKKVLAYSTVSQLGFMMLAMGVGGRTAGLFHLLTHAFFKALLFLGAGSIYHAVHTYEMPVLGGLQKKMKWTALTMLAATLAISGVPFFSGFYSKDAILASSIHMVFEEGKYQHILLFILPAVGAAITAFYMFRMWFLVFSGESRGYPVATHDDHGHAATASHGHDDHHHDPHPAKHAHESGPHMLYPLLILAVPTIVIGWPWTIIPLTGHPVLESMLSYGEPFVAAAAGNSHFLAFLASLIIATVGIGLGVLFYGPWPQYRKLDAAKYAKRFAPIYGFLVHKWYFDELYNAVLIQPCLKAAYMISNFDRIVVDGMVNGSAKLVGLVSRLSGKFDSKFVDGLVNGVADASYGFGNLARRLQTGRLRGYLMILAVAAVGLFAGVFAWVLS
jgi:proton-translocating NADH-quinone oxidoreductase chain L